MDSFNDIPRLSWESDHEWEARKSFLETNQHIFTGDRLASLSMAWSNWIFMGNNYGGQVQGKKFYKQKFLFFTLHCINYAVPCLMRVKDMPIFLIQRS